MQAFTKSRSVNTHDEFWALQHRPVFTQGLNGKKEHLLDPGDVPVVQVDRGGQVTYHGPGQVVVYLLVDIARKAIGVRQLVTLIETSVIDVLSDYGICAHVKHGAPGVYVNIEGQDAKIASLGLRIKKGRSYHGLSLNVDMDASPFLRINPCGYEGLAVTQLSEFVDAVSVDDVEEQLLGKLVSSLGYTAVENL